MTSLKEVGERQLVETVRSIIRPRSKSTSVETTMSPDGFLMTAASSPGPTTVDLERGLMMLLTVSTDVVTEERHLPETMTYEQFGWTAAAVNFSDIASMGAKPLGFLPAVTIPEDADESVLYDIMSGIDQCCEFCKTEVVGGDTKFGSLAVAGTAIGTMEGRKPMTRRGAQPGDIVAVTGMLGGPAAGYYAIKNGFEAEDQIFSLMVPVPHVEDGIKLSGTGVIHSCMDLSDGLANAATEICRQSHVGMEIEWEFLPVDDEVKDILEASHADLRDTVTRWGGEYELLFTLDRADLQKLYDAGIAFSIIGLVTNGEGPVLNDGEERKVMENGIY